MTTKNDDTTAVFPMPKGLSKAERSAVSRVIDMRTAAGSPLNPCEADGVVMYVRAQARLADLERLLRRGRRVTDYGSSYALTLAERLSLAAAIDRAAAACRRLAKDLKLSGS